MSVTRPLMLMTRWLALGAALGAATALALELLGTAGPWPEGPWQGIALVLALLAVFAISAFLFAHQQREQQTAERLRSGEAAIGELQREIDRHTQLEQQLLQAKKTAESAVLAKGEFLATMSHEIRTPLNGIVPMLDLLMNARLAPDQYELARTAYASSQQLLRIVDDILDYSKLEAHKLELETTAFNLRELLEMVMQLMERPAEAKGLRLHLHIDPAVRLPVRGDPVRLRQVLGNLVSNAVKFTERGAVMVNVRRIGESAAQHQLRFEVRDTGIGIAADAQRRLFQAFHQADASTTRLFGGTGLGLAICKRIVDLMGGRIDVQSEPGHGATFRFDIPLLKVHGDMPAREVEVGGGRLLLLSADARLRTRLSMLLPNWGLRVTSVETTQEALDRLRAAAAQGAPWAYSIVLADLSGMRSTALALYRNLERQAIYGDIRLVCLYGEDPVPEELQHSVNLLSRQAPDADLRAALTARHTEQPRSAEDARTATATYEPAGTARQIRVLLVEDNPVNLMVGQRLLGVLGADCDTANNGEAALLRMSASRYDLVLMDCQMPVMDGYTATRQWRENERAAGDTNHLPIVAMTANAMAGDRQKCLDAGMDDYLAKPVTRGELERCLQQWRRKPAAVPEHDIMPELPPSLTALADHAAPPAQAPATAPPIDPPATALATPSAPAPDPQPVATGSTATDVATSSSIPTWQDEAAAPPVLDRDVLDELHSAIGSEVDGLIELFLDEAPKLVDTLETAATVPDFQALQEAAHSLKSSSANMGAMALSAAAKRIELGARMQTLDRPAVAVALVVVEFARARTALLAEVASVQSAIDS